MSSFPGHKKPLRLGQWQRRLTLLLFPYAFMLLGTILHLPSSIFHLPSVAAQINTDRVMQMGRHALYYEDYVLSIQRFSMVINARPYLAEPYFFRGLAKFYLEDYSGAELDCNECIYRNPYISNYYQLRALCRIHQRNYTDAIADYLKAIDISPQDKNSWHNLVLCRFELEQWEEADSAADQMIRYWPKESENYTIKAQIAVQRGDTTTCLAWIDTALVRNAYDGQAWSMRSSISLQRGQYAQAEEELDKAILQLPRVAGNYINRALARFHQDNLRGAMTDYDHALEIEPRNYIGHYNRGLLRAQVGDDNRAIEDFDFVLSVEPDNMMALFNRALMLDNTGDYRGAIRDISAVIAEYPEFWTGYQYRAAIRRKIGDTYGAERDEFKVLKARMDARAGVSSKSRHKTRKQSERNIEDYNALVEADSNEPEREYTSVYRGRVQDRQVELSPQPIYVLAYHRMESATNRYIPYLKAVETVNASGNLARPVYITNLEPAISSADMEAHFTSIADYTQKMEGGDNRAVNYFGRALDAYHVRDFEAALADLDRCIKTDSKDALALFARAQVRCRQAEALQAQDGTKQTTVKLNYNSALDDLKKALQLAPDMVYAWYDMGNIYLAQHEYALAREAYSKALKLDSRFPDAYYNRGVACILDGQLDMGLSDLSQAGEYGLYQAYNLIKRYSKSLPSQSEGK